MSSRRLGKYEVVERLGRGGMAEVYRAYHANLGRYVAIKVLHAFLADDPEFQNRFENEARNIARLRHNHIVQVYDFETDATTETFYMVMELVDGVTLKEQLAQLTALGERPSLRESLRMVREAATALAYAHRQNMIHRDVKPANLMLDHDGRVVLTDFGIAKIITGIQFTASGGMVGTPAYMAPEQGLGDAGDERADLYSLGVILYQLVTGRLPYDAETPLAVILKHLNEPIPSARRYNPDLPEAVDAIILKLMAKDPADRYQNASALIIDIEAVEETLPPEPRTMVAKEPPLIEEPPIGEGDTNEVRTPVYAKGKASSSFLDDAPVAMPSESRRGRRSGCIWWLLIIAGSIVLVGGYAFANGGNVPIIGRIPIIAEALATSTPRPTVTPNVTLTSIATNTQLPSPVPNDTLAPTATFTQIVTTTFTETLPPSLTFTPSDTPTVTLTPSITNTPTLTLTPTIDLTLTLFQSTLMMDLQTATVRACDYDYRIIERTPEELAYFRASDDYEQTLTVQNTGTCPWERFTALVHLSGENFNATPSYVFINDRVNVGEIAIITIRGRTPARGGTYQGEWELRTPGQLLIGREPITIRAQVYEGG